MHKIKTLANGLSVAIKPMNQMESVSLGIWIRAGGRYENEKNSGISHFLEHLLFKGTKTRDTKKIKEEIEGRGGTFNGFTAEEFTCYLVKVLGKDASLGVDVLSDMVMNPRLDEEEVKKEKDVIIEEINMYKDMPSHYVHEILSEMLWPGQPLGMPLAGTVESVRSLAREDIVSYKKTHYNPNNILLVGTGNIEEDALIAIAEKYFSSMSGEKVSSFAKASLKKPKKNLKIHTKDTEQTHLAIGMHTLSRFHKDRYVLGLVNIILGANMSSRLFHIVRDEMALCYEIGSSARLYHDCGAFVVSAGVDNKKLIKALDAILREIGRMKKEPVGEDELRRAKEYYKGQLLLGLEDTMNYMLWLGEKIITGEKEYNINKILANVEAVGAEDIMRLSKELLRDENLNLAVIGPVKDKKGVEETLML